MSAVSMFFGVVITVNADDHVPPHIHAGYRDHEASSTLDDNLPKEGLPCKQRRSVKAWMLLHTEELEAGWEPTFNLEYPFRTDLLR